MTSQENSGSDKSYGHNKKQYDLYGKLYDIKRQDPATSYWNDQIDIPAITKLLKKELKGKRVLDLGCGSGIFARRLVAKGARVVGIDNSQTMIKLAISRLPKVKFITGDARKLPFQSGAFDITVSNLFIHYTKDLLPLFREINRVLEDDGEFVFSFHHPTAEVTRYRTIKERITAELMPYYNRNSYKWKMAKKMVLISHHHTFEDIFKALNKSGFLVAELSEPRPQKNTESINPEAFNITSQFPTFCAIRAIKIEGPPS
jgi:ubiquinone/menaquinone biosynthesis C-methylase UbiE